ncbi:unnamed protein product [Prunus armeniaca]|uniref:Uncharacterized protein n=1 Tax=Prunus armeniaca TaxID=36596 RepID=A0A6J5XR32_PRUAR|nr:hypothetical protein GBA52_019602 [Prunus armeniaca]CAB4284297.1 unnamed protein product [Prunus armeniaca]CAB4314692.1 unnamed protein product [Prunus armeniaca]
MCLLPQSSAPISYNLAVQQVSSTIIICRRAQRVPQPWPSKSEKSYLNEAAVVVISSAPTSCLSALLSFGCKRREEEEEEGEEQGKRKLHYEKVAFTLPILLT